MGHLGNEANRGYGVQGYEPTWAITAQGVWGTGGMDNMGNRSHGQWGTWAMGPMGNGAHGAIVYMGYRVQGYRPHRPWGLWAMGAQGYGAHGQ